MQVRFGTIIHIVTSPIKKNDGSTHTFTEFEHQRIADSFESALRNRGIMTQSIPNHKNPTNHRIIYTNTKVGEHLFQAVEQNGLFQTAKELFDHPLSQFQAFGEKALNYLLQLEQETNLRDGYLFQQSVLVLDSKGRGELDEF